jgi:predicted nucleic acid-binding protein
MGIFLDTGFYMGLIDPTDDHYNRSLEILSELQTGKFGQIFTSSFVMAESATLVASRTKKDPQAIREIRNFFIGNEQIALILRANEEIESDAWVIFQKLNLRIKNKVVSYIDCTNIAFCKKYLLDNILSFDPHYNSWLTRIS